MKYLRSLYRRYYRWRYQKVRVKQCEDSPISHQAGVFYLLTDTGSPWAMEFLCPCGCKESIMVNLIGTRSAWTLNYDQHGRINLSPSVWRTIGCRSHFWIRNGRIVWT